MLPIFSVVIATLLAEQASKVAEQASKVARRIRGLKGRRRYNYAVLAGEYNLLEQHESPQPTMMGEHTSIKAKKFMRYHHGR